MDYKLALSTFLAVFVAEMGDKTQLATFAFASGGRSKWAVFVGAALALVLTSAIAVVAGEWVGRVVPEVWVRRAAGVLFLVLGVAYLVSTGRS